MSKFESKSPREVAREVLEIEAAAVHNLLGQLDSSFDSAIALLAACKGRVVCTGMGKSGLVMKKISATLTSTGTPSLFLHPAEAIHGDFGMITDSDLVLAASYSGSTQELQRLAELVRRLGVGFIVMTGNANSPLARNATVHLPVEIDQEACPLNLAPTASSTGPKILSTPMKTLPAKIEFFRLISDLSCHVFPSSTVPPIYTGNSAISPTRW